MPYTFGLDFVRTVLTKEGKAAAYVGMLEHPPVDTLQVMEPDAYLQSKVAPPPTIPDLDKLIAPGYERYDFGGMGAFDVFLLARQYAPTSDAKQYYSHWRGGYYLAVHAKTAAQGSDCTDLPIALGLANRQQKHSRSSTAVMFPRAITWRRRRHGGRWRHHRPQNRVERRMPQGKVVLETHGNDLLIMEGLDDATDESPNGGPACPA